MITSLNLQLEPSDKGIESLPHTELRGEGPGSGVLGSSLTVLLTSCVTLGKLLQQSVVHLHF